MMVMATFRVRRANRIPMQFLGPAPKGRYVYGSMVSLFSLLNLDNDMVGKKEMKAVKHQKATYLYYLSRDVLLVPYRDLFGFSLRCLSVPQHSSAVSEPCPGQGGIPPECSILILSIQTGRSWKQGENLGNMLCQSDWYFLSSPVFSGRETRSHLG